MGEEPSTPFNGNQGTGIEILNRDGCLGCPMSEDSLLPASENVLSTCMDSRDNGHRNALQVRHPPAVATLADLFHLQVYVYGVSSGELSQQAFGTLCRIQVQALAWRRLKQGRNPLPKNVLFGQGLPSTKDTYSRQEAYSAPPPPPLAPS